jgi:hypothetical protein
MSRDNFTNSMWQTTRTWLFAWLALITFGLGSGGSAFGQVNYSENFDVNDGGWVLTGGVANGRTTARTCEGAGSLKTNIYGTFPTNTMRSPLIPNNTGDEINGSFVYKILNWNSNNPTPNPWGSITVQYGSTTTGPWTDITVIDANNHTPSTDCALVTFTFTPPAGELYFRLNNVRTAGDFDIYIDDVILMGPPAACPQPSGLNASLSSLTSINAEWDAVAEATNGYVWRVMAQGDDVENDTPVASGTTASGVTEVTATNIPFGNTYIFYVKADCDTDGESTWATSAPLLLDYCPSAATSTADTRIAQVALAGDERNSPVGLGNCAAYTDRRAEPAFEVKRLDPTAISVTRGTCGSNFNSAVRVYIDLNQDGVLDETTEVVFQGTMGNTAATATTTGVLNIPIDAELGNTLIRFVVRETGDPNDISPCGQGGAIWGETQDYLINIQEEDNCLIPSNVTISNITDVSAQVDWSIAVAPENGFEYVVSTVNETPADAGTSETNTSISLSNLSPNTNYFVFIRSACEAGEFSNWSPAASFTTECDVDLPIVQNFDDVTVPDLPTCWSSVAVFSSFSGGVQTSTTTPVNSAPNQVQMFSTTSTATLMLISPLLKESAQDDQYLVTFSARTSFGTPDLLVGTMTNKADASTFTAEETVTLSTTYQQFTALITTTEPFIAFRRGETTAQVFLDDITIEELPSCFSPVAPQLTAVDRFEASFSFTEPLLAPENGYEYKVMLAGDDIDTDTPVSNILTASLTPTVAGLQAETDYEFYVRSVCLDGDVSNWTNAVPFTTEVLCPKPDGMSGAPLSFSSIAFNWGGAPFATNGYEWRVMITGQDVDEDTPAASGTTTSDVTDAVAEGLQEQTTYQIYVRALCDDGAVSIWDNPLSVTTLCDTQSLPVSENFDQVTTPNLPICWSAIITTPGAVGTSTLGTPFSAPNQIRIANGANTTNFIGLVSPELDEPSSGFYKVSFRSRSLTAAGAPLEIGTLTDPEDETTFVLAATVSPTNAATAQLFEVAVPFVPNESNYIVFKHGNGANSQTIYVDDIKIEKGLLNDLEVINVFGPFTAVQGVNNPMSINANIRNNSVIPVSGTVPLIISVSGANTANFNFNLNLNDSPLAPGEVTRVQLLLPNLVSNLGENVITYNLPDDDNNDNNSASFTQEIDPANLNFANNDAFLAGTIPANQAREFITNFRIADERVIPHVDVYLANGAGAIGRPVYVRIYDNDFNILGTSETFTAATPDDLNRFVRFNFATPVEIPGDAVIPNRTFRVSVVNPEHTAQYAIVGVQNELPLGRNATFQVRIAADVAGLSAAPIQAFASLRYGLRLQLFDPNACFPPTNLAAGSITESGATISWGNNPLNPVAPDNYEILYGLSGFDIATEGSTAVVTGTENTVTLTGLQSSRNHDVYVRTVCSADPETVSIWEKIEFRTECGGEEPLPFLETFEPTSETLPCLAFPDGVGNLLFVPHGAYGQSATSLRIRNWSGISNGDLRSVEFPVTEPTVGKHKIAFDHAHRRFTTTVEQLRVEASSDGGDNYTILETLLGGVDGPLTTDAAGFGEFTDPTGFWASKSFDLPEGTNRVKLTMVSAAGNNLFLDNIEVRCANDAEFEYAAASFCTNEDNPEPTIIGDAGGIFSSTTGLAIDAETGVIDLAASTPGDYTVTYTVDDSNGCFADSQTFDITIQGVATISGDANQEFCGGGDFTVLGYPSVQDLTVVGDDLFWFTLDDSNNEVEVTTTAFIISGTYFVRAEPSGLCPSEVLTINVTVSQTVFAGDDSSPTFCAGDDSNLDLNNYRDDDGGTWTDAEGDVVTVTEFAPSSLGAGQFAFTYTIPANGSCPGDAVTVTLNINPVNNAGGNRIANYCSTDGTIDLADLLGANAQAGGSWFNELGSSLSDTNFDTNTAEGAYIFTYEAAGGVCPTDEATITVNITSFASAGENAVVDVCNTADVVDLFASLNGNPVAGGAWTDAEGDAAPATFDPEVGAGTYVFTYTQNEGNPCEESATVTVNVTNQLSAGTNGSATVCQGVTLTLADLFAELSDNPAEGGTWSLNGTPQTANFVAANDGLFNFVYTIAATGGCAESTATVAVTVDPATPSAGENGNLELCDLDPETNLFDGLNGTPAAGGVWTDPDGIEFSGIIDPATFAEGTYVFTYTHATVNVCPTNSATVTVEIGEGAPNAGEDAQLTVCANEAPFDARPLLGSAVPSGGTWFVANAQGENILDENDNPIVVASPFIVNPLNLNAGTSHYKYRLSNSCGADSSLLSITVNEMPLAILSFNGVNAVPGSTFEYCEGTEVDVLISSVMSGVAPFTFVYQINDEDELTVSDLEVGDALFSGERAPGTYNIVVNSLTDANNCSLINPADVYNAVVTINPTPALGIRFNGELAVTDSEFEYCENTEVTVTLGEVLFGTAPFNITYQINDETPVMVSDLNEGDVIVEQTPEVGTYNVRLLNITDASGCSVDGAADIYTANVTINANPVIGVSFNGELAVTGSEFEYCDGTEVEVTLSGVVSGTAPFTVTYQIGDEDPVTVSDLAEGDVIVAQTPEVGAYNVVLTEITDANGCSFDNPAADYNATVIINAKPVIGVSFNGELAVTGSEFAYCEGTEVSVTLSAIAAGVAPFSVTYQIGDEDPVMVSDLAEGDVIVAQTPEVGAYNVVLTNITDANGCSFDNPSEDYNAVVTINANPVIGVSFNGELAATNSEFNFCEGDEVTVTLSNIVAGMAPFSVTYQIDDEDPVIVTDLEEGDVIVANTPEVGSYTVKLLDITDANACSVDSPQDDYVATVNVGVRPAVLFSFNGEVAETGSTFTYCETEEVTVVMSSVLAGVAPFAVTYTVNNEDAVTVTVNEGDELFADVLDAGSYSIVINSIVGANDCGVMNAADIYNATVVLTPLNNAGVDFEGDVCIGDEPITAAELLEVLGEDAQEGGDWTDAEGNAVVFPIELDELGTLVFTYTVSGGECADASATVTININAAPNAGENGEVTVVVGADDVDLFAALNGDPEEGGTWFDAEGDALEGSTFSPDMVGSFEFTYVVTNSFDCERSATVTVNVVCAAIAEFPFVETFENDSDSRDCWTNEFVSGTAIWTYATGAGAGTTPLSNTAFEGDLNARFVSAPPLAGGGPITKLVSPMFDLSSLETPMLSFHYGQEVWAGDINELKVYYRTAMSEEWVEIAHFEEATTNWVLAELLLPEPSSTYQLAFEGINNWGRANVLDNIIIDEAPTCINPGVLAASNITDESAVITWNNDNAEATFEVLYGEAGFDVETEGVLLEGITETTVTLTGLDAQTEYDVYVRAICSEEDASEWVSISFTTSCGIFDLDFVETFEVDSESLGCWTIIGGTGWGIFGTEEAPAGGFGESNRSARFNFFNISAAAPQDLISPLFEPTNGTYELSFDHAYRTFTDQVDRLQIWTLTQGAEEATLLIELEGGPEGPLATLPPATTNFVPTADDWETVSFELPEGTVRVILRAISDFGNNLYLDNITVSSDCLANAGEDGAADVCDGDLEFDLNTMLSEDADSDGVWTTASGDVVPNGIIVPNDIEVGDYTYFYAVGDEECNDTAEFEVSIDVCDNIAELGATNFNVSYFPNPASTDVNLYIYGNMNNQTELRILDLTGKEVAKMRVKDQVSSIDVSYLAEGIYLFELVSGDTVKVNRISVKH